MHIEDYKPTPIRDAWTRVVFFFMSLFRGSLGLCDRCGMLTECYRYGTNVESHQMAGAEHAQYHVGTPNYKRVLEPYASMRVCLMCDIEIGEELNIHDGCWCRLPIADHARR
jgi:hypothetical protein